MGVLRALAVAAIGCWLGSLAKSPGPPRKLFEYGVLRALVVAAIGWLVGVSRKVARAAKKTF